LKGEKKKWFRLGARAKKRKKGEKNKLAARVKFKHLLLNFLVNDPRLSSTKIYRSDLLKMLTSWVKNRKIHYISSVDF
jgi:hypothetical protein